MKLSILIATLNRDTLRRCLASCAGADEIILVADGQECAGAADILRESGLSGRAIVLPIPYADFGHTPRQIGLGYCSGDFIAHMDDDDYYLPGAIEQMKAALTEPCPHFFRAEIAHLGITVWREPRLSLGDISTLCIAHPNDRCWGVWPPRHGGDWEFAASTAANYERVVWSELVVARSEIRGSSPKGDS
jgi:glycosyltransferase involved in cell wall biosynthesis